jgi:hypothetical protein
MHLANLKSFLLLFCFTPLICDCGGGSASTSSTQPTVQAPAAPATVSAVPGDAKVVLTWTPSSTATSYQVYRSEISGSQYTRQGSSQSTESYTDHSASNGTTYFYVVQAGNEGGWSGNSIQVSARPSGLVQERVDANLQNFYVYLDADSGFNHGSPSGWFASPLSNLTKIHIDAGCVDNPMDSTTGCYSSSSTSVVDTSRGTVFRFTFDPQPAGDWVGVNFEEPQNWGVLQTGSGYDLHDVQDVTFDVRSPDSAQISFGVGECTTPSYVGPISSAWTTVTISIGSLVCNWPLTITHPDMSNVHILFSVSTDGDHSPNGATVLLDNIRFTPTPARATQTALGETLSLPVSNQAFGVVAQPTSPFPPDQANRNFAAIYEASLAIQVLLNQGDTTNAQAVADALHYALYHDNQGDYLAINSGLNQCASSGATINSGCFSGAPNNRCALHDSYEDGDIALFNDQGSGPVLGKAGDSRLAGFSCGSGYCSTQDTATGGNNSWALLALLAEYKSSGIPQYLNDAIAIGNWIVANLTDCSGSGYGGYFVGFSQIGQAPPKSLNFGKSTENNADIFIALSSLAKYDTGNAAKWNAAANAAGDFVMQMYDEETGRFNSGTEPKGTPNDGTPGSCPTGAVKGNDIINTNSSADCDFLDADTFTTLAMAGSARYSQYQFADGKIMDWRRPVQYAIDTFAQTVSAEGQQYQGFDIVPNPVPAADGTITDGIAWEFTGQMVETMRYVDQLYNQTTFEATANSYLAEMQMAQADALYGDGQGLVASLLSNISALPPVDQCLNTPFDNCPPERVGLAATTWMILAEQQANPLMGP